MRFWHLNMYVILWKSFNMVYFRILTYCLYTKYSYVFWSMTWIFIWLPGATIVFNLSLAVSYIFSSSIAKYDRSVWGRLYTTVVSEIHNDCRNLIHQVNLIITINLQRVLAQVNQMFMKLNFQAFQYANSCKLRFWKILLLLKLVLSGPLIHVL